MAKVAITQDYLQDIADAIRTKTGLSSTYYPSEMAQAILSISGSGGITPTGTINIIENGTHNVTQYATANVQVPVGSTINNQNKIVDPSQSGNSVTADSGYTGLGTVTVNPISTTYVGSGIARKSSTDLTASGATVTAPAGYYASSASKAVSSMTLPTAAAATSSGTSKATISRSTSDQYINIPTGYNSTASYYKINAVANGSATAPTSISANSASVSTGTNTLTLSKTVSVTPSVSAGYVSAGTAGNSLVSLTANVTTKGAAIITPGTTNQTIASGTYLTGTQTISGDANLVAGNIKSGTSIFGISGTYAGSGGITPSGNINITQAGVTDVTNYATATVPTATYNDTLMIPSSAFEIIEDDSSIEVTSSGEIFASFITAGNLSNVVDQSGYINSSDKLRLNIYANLTDQLSIQAATTITPSTSVQTAVAAGKYTTGAVTVAAMPSGSATAPASISGTAATVSTGTNTLTLTKTVSVTPRVTTAGYVSAGTAGNSSVSLTANITTKAAATITPGTSNQTIASGTYLTGTQTISGDSNLVASNIKDGVSIFGVTGTYEGESGGGSSILVGTKTATPAAAGYSISFTGLLGEPTSFAIVSASNLATGASPFKVSGVVYDGTSVIGQTVTNTSNAQVTYDGTNFSKSYSNGTLTVTSSSAYFQANEYKLTYSYNGSTSDVSTADVQVGSGATSITFTGLADEPTYFSCIFKSNFSTSSGYQRVIMVVYDGTSTYGMEMDSSAKANTSHWSYTYNNGSLVISSSGTNAGGYFHQPGYYQLTYVISDGSGDTGIVTAPSTITGTSATVTTGTNTLTLTKTVSVIPDVTTPGYISRGTAGNSNVSLTASVTTKGAATITPTTTNQTIASGTYLTGTQTISGDANLVSGNIISGKSIFGVSGSVVLQTVYTGSSAPSSSTGVNGDIYIQK